MPTVDRYQLILELDPVAADTPVIQPLAVTATLLKELALFREFGQQTVQAARPLPAPLADLPTFINEFWTARQRAANSLHEISYRACFKPQLPRFFINRLTKPGDRVYDPFMGRGTTLIEAALLGRRPTGCDINPLSVVLTRPRLRPPALEDVAERLKSIPLNEASEDPEELLVFYHPETLREICALKAYLLNRHAKGSYDALDDWIAMVALNRLTGHSPGFFSVYTLPPNQATSVQAQRRINERRKQVPPRRSVKDIILKKSRQLLKECDAEAKAALASVADHASFITGPASDTPDLESNSVDLVVTSPPFLGVVQYATDNWLRCWFLGVNASQVKLTMCSRLDKWQEAMTAVFRELHRVLKPGAFVAFEVGEVDRGKVALEDAVFPCGLEAGLEPVLLLINQQEFTKTAQCWGVDNNTKGTNSNRIVLFRKGLPMVAPKRAAGDKKRKPQVRAK